MYHLLSLLICSWEGVLKCRHAGPHFAVIHRGSLKTVTWIFNRPITNFYNGDNVNISVAELGQTKTRSRSFVMIRILSNKIKSNRCKWTLKKNIYQIGSFCTAHYKLSINFNKKCRKRYWTLWVLCLKFSKKLKILHSVSLVGLK